MTKAGTKFTVKFVTVTSICLLLLIQATAQQPANPRGMPPPLPNTPDSERNWERINDRRPRKWGARTPSGRPVLGDVRKDFVEIQNVTSELLSSITSQSSLNYKYVSDSASRIRTLAGRLNSNLALGKPQIEGEPPEVEYTDALLRASIFSLNRFVTRFVDNPIFKERGVFDIEQNRKAKQDIDGIISLSDHIKRITRRMRQQN